jgi:hypothetical protein
MRSGVVNCKEVEIPIVILAPGADGASPRDLRTNRSISRCNLRGSEFAGYTPAPSAC